MSETLVLFSRLPPEGCAYRLRRKVRRDDWWWSWGLPLPWWWYRGAKSFIGYIGRSSLRLRNRVLLAHPFQTMCYGKIEPSGVGSRITCRFGLTPFGTVISTIWLFLTLGTCISVVADRRALYSDGIVALALIAGAFVFFRWLAREEESKLRNFLCDVLEARETDTFRD